MTNKGGLGRGLGSLISSKKTDEQINNNNHLLKKEDFVLPKELKEETDGQLIYEMSIEKIIANPKQPRQHFDEKSLDDLAQSIQEYGILQPLVVSKIADNKFEIIAGERRFRAAQKAGLSTVPAIVRSATEQQKFELAIIENIQREDINPIDEAKAYQRLNNEFNLTHEDIAKKLGKSRSQITNIIRLLDLPDRVQESLIAGEITIGHAKTIASLPDEGEQMELFKSILRGHLNVRETEASAKTKNHRATSSSKILKNPNITEKEDSLRNTLHTKVNIKQRGGRGKIEIDFYSGEELDNIINQITSSSQQKNLL